MSIKKKVAVLAVIVAVILLNVWILTHKGLQIDQVEVKFSVMSDTATLIQLFYSKNDVFDLEHMETATYENPGEEQECSYSIPSDATSMRLDLGDTAQSIVIKDMQFNYEDTSKNVDMSLFEENQTLECHGIKEIKNYGREIAIIVEGEDPYISISSGPSVLADIVQKHLQLKENIKNILYTVFFDMACLVLLFFRKKFSSLPVELFQNRHLILNLAKNDFKTKYAGSYLGIFWAFVQPIVTVLVYWFVFQVGLRSQNMNNFPFVLWLVAGLVPWFFFQDTLNGGTNALIEYSYLVKKVVFKISILPIVKAFSALFVHAFFVIFMIILYTCYGYFPDLYVLQVIYYTLALFVLTLGICYATCAVVIFFRDLTQIINIVLQVGIWMTPIMWNIDIMGVSMPRIIVLILKANPLYYIVNGYRDALINKIWFWERFDLTVYYWIVTTIVFMLGSVIFKRLKIHFADIL